VARRKPVSIATDGMYRKVGAIALGLALCAAMLGDDTPAPPTAVAVAQSGSRPSSEPAAFSARAALADRDDASLLNRDDEVQSLLIAETPEQPTAQATDTETGLPKVGYSSAENARGPTPAQINALIQQSYARSGNTSGGD
jgi:hypothetical protein